MLIACVCVCLGEFNSFQLIPACEECEPDTARLVGGDKWESFPALWGREHCATCVCQRWRGAAAGANHPQVCGLKYVHAVPPPYTSPGWLGALPSSGTERGWSRQQREHGPCGTHSCREVLWPRGDRLSCSQLIGRNRPHGPRSLRAREWNVTTCQEGRGWKWLRTSSIMSWAHPSLLSVSLTSDSSLTAGISLFSPGPKTVRGA